MRSRRGRSALGVTPALDRLVHSGTSSRKGDPDLFVVDAVVGMRSNDPHALDLTPGDFRRRLGDLIRQRGGNIAQPADDGLACQAQRAFSVQRFCCHSDGRLGNDRLLVRSLGELCRMYYHAREPRRGLPLGQEAVERARQLGDDILLGESLLKWLTNVDPPGSGPLFAEAIACTERSGDLLTNCRLHNNAGDKALIAGDIPAARAHLEAAAQAGQAIGFEHSDLPNNMGHLLRAEGDLDAARSTFETGLRTSRRNGDGRAMAYGILGLACLASDARDWNRAGVLHGVAQAFLNRIGSPWQEFDARCRQDSLDQAREHLGDPQLECAYAYGMALSLDQAHELILRKADPA